jgi:hypothetical protein
MDRVVFHGEATAGDCGSVGEELRIKRTEMRDEFGDVVPREDGAPAGFADPLPQAGIDLRR